MGPASFRYPQLSPDGRYLAFIQPAPKTGVNSVFVAALPPFSGSGSSGSNSSSGDSSSGDSSGGGGDGPLPRPAAAQDGGDGSGALPLVRPGGAVRPVQVSFNRARGVSDYFWARDSSAILYLVDSGSGSETYQLFLVPLAPQRAGGPASSSGNSSGAGGGGGPLAAPAVTPGAAINLTPFKGVKVQGLWLSNAFPRRAYVGINKRSRATFDIHAIDLASQRLTLDTVSPGDVTSWLVDPGFNISAAIVSRPDGSRALRVRDLSTADGCPPAAASADRPATRPASNSSGSSSRGAAGSGAAAKTGARLPPPAAAAGASTGAGGRKAGPAVNTSAAAAAVPSGSGAAGAKAAGGVALLRGLRRLAQHMMQQQPQQQNRAGPPAVAAKPGQKAQKAGGSTRPLPPATRAGAAAGNGSSGSSAARGRVAGSNASSSSSSVNCSDPAAAIIAADGTLDGSGGDLGGAAPSQQPGAGCEDAGSSMAALIASSASRSNVSCWAVVYEWPLGEEGRVWGFNKAGDGLYVSTSRNRDTTELQLISRADGSVLKHLASHPLADVGEVVMDQATRQPAAVSFDYHKPSWTWAAAEDQADWDRLAAWQPDSVLLPVSWSRDKQSMVVAYSKGDGNTAYYLHRRGAAPSAPPRLLFNEQPGYANYTLAATHPVVIAARDGLRLPGYLTLPPLPGVPRQLPAAVTGVAPDGSLLPQPGPGQAKKRSSQQQQQQGRAGVAQAGPLGQRLDLPMVLLVHGGPWRRASWGSSAGLVQWLANRGYAVLNVNFRGSTGYGKRFTNAGDKQWGTGAMQHDLSDAVAWAVAAGIADPKRVCIMGGSYGGYATFAGLAFTPELYACGVSFSGIANLASLVATMPPWWSPLKQRWLHRVGNVTADAALNRRLSPVFHADRMRAPLLIGQGGNDVRVIQAEADAMHQALKAQGHPNVTYVLYPDEGHGLTKVANRVDFYSRAEQLLARVLGGRSTAPQRPAKSSVRVAP